MKGRYEEMYEPTRDDVEEWQEQLSNLEEAIPYLDEALQVLRQPGDTGETLLLEDLISTLEVKRNRLEDWLLGIDEEELD